MTSRSPAVPDWAADLMRHDMVADAAHNLRQVFGDTAGAEALTRALVCERTEDRDMARFWTAVYALSAEIEA